MRERAAFAAAVLVGPAVGALLLGSVAPALLLRLAAASGALALVVAGLVATVRLGRAEWARSHPARGAYLRVAARFGAALVLLVVATG